jgi:hypothetical protein
MENPAARTPNQNQRENAGEAPTPMTQLAWVAQISD